MTLYRVTESFPFDSSKPTKFDDYGRPILDRAVSSRTMRDSFAKIFSNGVFGKPADAFIISKGDGLNVKINPGMCVIDGAMGGWREEQTFALPAATGKVAYGIFLRLDDNSDMRSIYVRIDAGAAGSNPTPPAPESGDKVTELRLGYVVVPSGATDLSEATITNEKGLEVCPYTAPFAEIDLAEIIHDAQTYADERNEEFTAYLVENMEFIASCLDGTVAGNLQAQIDELKTGGNLADSLDPRNLELASDTPTGTPLLRISENFVDGTLAQIDTETRKLMLQVQAIRAAMGLGDTLGVLQPEYGGTGGLLPVANGGTGVGSESDLAKLVNSSMRGRCKAVIPVSVSVTLSVKDTYQFLAWHSSTVDLPYWASTNGKTITLESGMYAISYNITAKCASKDTGTSTDFCLCANPVPADQNTGTDIVFFSVHHDNEPVTRNATHFDQAGVVALSVGTSFNAFDKNPIMMSNGSTIGAYFYNDYESIKLTASGTFTIYRF